MDRLEAFISGKDRDDITAAVKDVETRTSGEIVPMVVSSSSEYPAATFLTALVLSMIAGVIAASAAMHSESVFSLLNTLVTAPGYRRMLSLLVFLAVFLPALPAFRALAVAAPFIKKVVLSRAEMREQVEETAVAAFRRHNLDKTRERNGVLIFISVFERKVKIIADRGINEKVSPGEWQAIADALASEIRKGNRAGSIIQAVRRCGDLLSNHFPFKPGDRDELENLIVEK